MDRKLKLDVTTLTVNAFETSVVSEVLGTVQGQEADFAPTEFTNCLNASYCCPTRHTCTTKLC